MTKTALALLLTMVLAMPLAAQTTDVLALVPMLKAIEPGPTCREGVAAMEQVTLHLVIYNPTAGGVGGWKTGGFEVEGGVLIRTLLTAGSDPTPDGEFHVHIGSVPRALRPNDSGLVHLADVTVLVPSADSDVLLRLRAPGDGTGFSYTGPYRDQTPWPLTVHSEETGALTYRFAPDCSPEVGNDQVAWSALKALYR